jgi:hypothetical protein
MTPPPLPLERFRELTAAYGARLELWPEDAAAAARELLAASAEARALFDAEAELDREFAAASAPAEVPPQLLRRLNEVPIRAPQRRVLWPFGRAWVPALGWAFAAALGVSWGLFAPPFEASESDTGAAVASAASPAADAAPAVAEDDFAALARGTLVDFEE